MSVRSRARSRRASFMTSEREFEKHGFRRIDPGVTSTLETEISRLSQEEKLALIGKVWRMLDADALPVPPVIVQELERRRAKLDRDPSSLLTLEALMAEVHKRL